MFIEPENLLTLQRFLGYRLLLWVTTNRCKLT